MLRRAALPLVLLLLLLLTTAAPASAADRIAVSLRGAFSLHGKGLAVSGRTLRANVRVAPYVPGQQVRVRVWLGRTLLAQRSVAPTPTSTGRTATFSVRFVPRGSGKLQVFALHDATPQQGAVSARAALPVVAPVAGPGSRGPFVALFQQRLAAVGYATPQTGVYDPLTGLAVLAFRKVNGMARVETLSPAVVDRVLRGVGAFRIRYPEHGRHVEANLGWQVLAEIDHGRVFRAYTTSSGKPSTPTVLGHFRFYMREPGTNGHGMVDSTYFIRGYAIHGYYDVPPFAASHGCLRVPIPDAFAIYSWVHVGDRIDVYY